MRFAFYTTVLIENEVSSADMRKQSTLGSIVDWVTSDSQRAEIAFILSTPFIYGYTVINTTYLENTEMKSPIQFDGCRKAPLDD